MATKRMEIMCTAYCGCGHCCGWEWGITLPGMRYVSLGDWNAPKHTLSCKTDSGRHAVSHRLGHPLQALQHLPASISTVLSMRPKSIQVKRRVERKGCRPGLLCKYWTKTSQAGQPYEGITSSGTFPAQARAAVLSTTQLKKHPVHHVRRVLAPWTLLPRTGTIAADTRHFPFGTKMLVPGYGWAEVQDEGSAITGAVHVDLFHDSHGDAIVWGKRKLKVLVVPPGKHPTDHVEVDDKVRPVLKAAHDLWTMFFGVHHEDDDNDCRNGH